MMSFAGSRKEGVDDMKNLYTGMKVFHFKEKMDSLPRDVKEILPPVHIRIKPTNVCSHNCWYCAYRSDGLQLGMNMKEADFIPRQKMMEIIDDIIDMGVKAVTFSGGGDPFCYPYLYDAAIRLSKSPVKFAALTNGSLLKGRMAALFAAKAEWVRISMDGWDDRSYSRYRKVPVGEFTKIVKNIRAFRRYGGSCYLGVSIIVGRGNASHIYGLIRSLKRTGANSIKIAPCIVSNDGMGNNLYHKPIFDKVKAEIRKAVKRLSGPSFEIFDAYHGQLESFKKDYRWCPYLQILPVIGADQNIYPCQDKAYNLKEGLVGSIKDRTFKDFWFSDKNKFFKIDPGKVCNHHCVANSKNRMIIDYLNADRRHLEFV
jgi:MoaA/NifB/PqqE/SkfB family radical SAM enzyme